MPLSFNAPNGTGSHCFQSSTSLHRTPDLPTYITHQHHTPIPPRHNYCTITTAPSCQYGHRRTHHHIHTSLMRPTRLHHTTHTTWDATILARNGGDGRVTPLTSLQQLPPRHTPSPPAVTHITTLTPSHGRRRNNISAPAASRPSLNPSPPTPPYFTPAPAHTSTLLSTCRNVDALTLHRKRNTGMVGNH